MFIIKIVANQAPRGGIMKFESAYPVICTDKLIESRDFYTHNFNFEITFEADWYISLRSKESPVYELALMNYQHPGLPQDFRQPTKGVLLNFEVSDVDQEYDRLKQRGLPIVFDLKSEEWGQRHFITKDPNELLVDVIQNVPPSEAFSQQYTQK
jgi:catechol 2,3-dioxygenase-like lactoylglutathione lyase family enzyme